MSFKQPDLPYAMGALVPFLSEEQVNFHYGKHHAAYCAKLNSLVQGTPQSEMALEDLVVQAEGAVFNNAAQAWNHTFYWRCLTQPGHGGAPKGDFKAAIERSFHSIEAFKDEFSKAAVGIFGSGWAWLGMDNQGRLEILALSNADNPLRHGKRPLMTIDVWEHAYYIDYRNDRLRYVASFWDSVNWSFIEQLYSDGHDAAIGRNG